jgi:hypothetical protein
MPQAKITINEKVFPSEYVYINDTLCISRIIEPDGKGDFKQSAGKWNMTTGQISIMPYNGPKGVHKKTGDCRRVGRAWHIRRMSSLLQPDDHL